MLFLYLIPKHVGSLLKQILLTHTEIEMCISADSSLHALITVQFYRSHCIESVKFDMAYPSLNNHFLTL
jgi:hypothetical protein